MFGSFGGGSSKGSGGSSNSGGSGVSAGGGREITIRCGRGSYETRNHYWSEKAQACVDIYASSASKYPSGTGSSSREGRGGGGGKSGSDESKESGREYSSYTSSVKYSTTGLRKLHNDYLQSKFSTFDVGYGQIHSNAIIGTNHFSQGVPFVNEVVTTIRSEVSKGTLHHKLAINASNRGLVDVDLYNLGTQLSGSSGTTTSGVTLNLCLFDLHQNNITHLGMNNFLHFFKWQNINEVNFSSNQLGDNSCRQLGQAFSAAWLPHLFNLNLSNNQIGDSGGQYLAQSLTGHFHNNLKYLNLANNNLTNNGITPFADGLSSGKITKLKTLHLEGNKFSPDGEAYVIKGIKASPNTDLKITFVEAGTRLLGKPEAIWKTATKFSLNKFLEHAEKQGIDTSHIATNKSTLDYIFDVFRIGGNIGFGVAKCSSVLLEALSFSTNAPSVAKGVALEMYGTKAMKKVDLRVCVTMEIYDGMLSSEGVDLAVKAIDLLGDD